MAKRWPGYGPSRPRKVKEPGKSHAFCLAGRKGRIRIGPAHRLVERGNLVVELIPTLVEAAPAATGHFLCDRHVEAAPGGQRLRRSLHQPCTELQHVEPPPSVTIRGLRDEFERFRLGGQMLFTEPPLLVRQGCPKQRRDVLDRQ